MSQVLHASSIRAQFCIYRLSSRFFPTPLIAQHFNADLFVAQCANNFVAGSRALKGNYLTAVLVCLLIGCSEPSTDTPTLPVPQSAQETSQVTSLSPTPRQLQLWTRSCALCHIDGKAGAPRLGHRGDWQELRLKSSEELLESVVSGLNDMPPLGYCMACETSDFEALISMMLASGGGQ